MYIVNTSFFVDHQVHDRWLEIITGKYIPLLVESGFEKPVLTRALSVESTENFTYSLMVDAPDMEAYRRLTEELFDQYKGVATPLFGNRIVWLTTLLKKIDC